MVLSEAAPAYAPVGRALVATSVVHGEPTAPVDGARPPALARLHGTDTAGWELVATSDVPHALPGMTAPHPLRRPVRVTVCVYVAGDHRDTSPIQGALVSGRRAATTLLQDVGVIA